MQQSQAHVIRESTLQQADLVLRPNVSVVKLPLTEEVLADCFQAGEDAVVAALPTMRRLLLSNEDCTLLDVALRHRFIRPQQAATIVAKTIERTGRDLASVLQKFIEPSAVSLIRDLASHVLVEESRGQIAQAMGEAISGERLP